MTSGLANTRVIHSTSTINRHQRAAPPPRSFLFLLRFPKPVVLLRAALPDGPGMSDSICLPPKA